MSKHQQHLSDEELIYYILEGNQSLFSQLAERYEKYIFNTCMTYVKDQNQAQDLSQEVLIKLFLQLASFRKEARFTTWLFSIIHHTCVDHLRKNKKNIHSVLTEKLADEVIDIVDSNQELEPEKTMEILDKLLGQMTPEGRLLLILKYKEKHPIKDIQLAMGLSESAVKMRLKRAKEVLNKLYEQSLKEIKQDNS